MRIVLTGGCTGGHIYPALAIGDKLRENDSTTEILYIGNNEGIEKEIVPKNGYNLKLVSATWLERDSVLRIFKTVTCTLKGKREAKKILKEFKPDAVISTGSFVSVPVVLAAKSLKLPVYIHEQNGFPGISNRILSKYARIVFLGFKQAAQYFKSDINTIYSGNPVRKIFYNINKADMKARLKIPENVFVIMIFGGSLGARSLNEIAHALIQKYGNNKEMFLIIGTGKGYFNDFCKSISDCQYRNIKVLPFIDDMETYLGASDIIISRAGALSLSEILVTGRTAIFIPSPNVTADHQYYNAKFAATGGGSFVIQEGGDCIKNTLEKVQMLISDKNNIEKYEKNNRNIAPIDATDIICNNILEDLRKKKDGKR